MLAIYSTKPLISHSLNIGLNVILIFGIEGWIPSLGVHGAALGTLFSKLIASLCFWMHFMKKYRNTSYQVENVTFNWKLLREGLSKGMPRALGGVLVMLNWSLLVYLMTDRGGDYLLALSLGASLFLPFFSEAISQGVIGITSYLIGSQLTHHLGKVVRSALFLNAIGLVIVAIPLLIFPRELLSFFLSYELSSPTKEILIKVCQWIWFMYLCNSIYFIVFGITMAYKETFFYLMMNVLGMFFWTYVPVYCALQIFGAGPDVFWLVVAFQPLFPAVVLCLMLFRKHWRKKNNLVVP